jgi:ABC-type thiamin/hydroxymethylpyrimidine transport system permease subunit
MMIGTFTLSRIFNQNNLRKRFYVLFPLGFFAYSVGWVIAYFVVKGVSGEWVASLLSSILLAIIFVSGFKKPHFILSFVVILFIANSLGYFLGSMLNQMISGKLGMILWGLSYGVFLGAGIGVVSYFVEKNEAMVQR